MKKVLLLIGISLLLCSCEQIDDMRSNIAASKITKRVSIDTAQCSEQAPVLIEIENNTGDRIDWLQFRLTMIRASTGGDVAPYNQGLEIREGLSAGYMQSFCVSPWNERAGISSMEDLNNEITLGVQFVRLGMDGIGSIRVFDDSRR